MWCALSVRSKPIHAVSVSLGVYAAIQMSRLPLMPVSRSLMAAVPVLAATSMSRPFSRHAVPPSTALRSMLVSI